MIILPDRSIYRKLNADRLKKAKYELGKLRLGYFTAEEKDKVIDAYKLIEKILDKSK